MMGALIAEVARGGFTVEVLQLRVVIDRSRAVCPALGHGLPAIIGLLVDITIAAGIHVVADVCGAGVFSANTAVLGSFTSIWVVCRALSKLAWDDLGGETSLLLCRVVRQRVCCQTQVSCAKAYQLARQSS